MNVMKMNGMAESETLLECNYVKWISCGIYISMSPRKSNSIPTTV